MWFFTPGERNPNQTEWHTLYVQRFDIPPTSCIHHTTSKHSTCLLPVNPVLNLLHFVSCHRKPLMYFPQKFLLFLSSPRLEAYQQKYNDPRPQTGNAEATNTFKSRVAWFVQKPKTFCWISCRRWNSGQAPRQSSAIFQHMHACTYTYLHMHIATATLTLMSKFTVIIRKCAGTHLNLQVYKNKCKILIFDVE